MFFLFYFLFTHGLPKYLSENPIESLQYRTRKPLSSATVLCSAVMTVRIRNYTRPLVNLTVNPISFFKSKSASRRCFFRKFPTSLFGTQKIIRFQKKFESFFHFLPPVFIIRDTGKKSNVWRSVKTRLIMFSAPRRTRSVGTIIKTWCSRNTIPGTIGLLK